MNQATTHWIESDSDLQLCCAKRDDSKWIALDTEFERVRTYYPRLCLIQLATASDIWLLDPLRLTNLDQLKLTLNNTKTVIIHAARQDLEVLDYALEMLPATLFDTQVGAAFLGLGDQTGYASLVQQTQGIELEKSQTRTNWCQRPLTTSQLQYAADDVRYLGPIYLQLQRQLGQQGKLPWMLEEMTTTLTQHAWQLDPLDTAKRLLGTRSRLSRSAQNCFVALAQWREALAIQRNLPREWVVGNDILRQIAEVHPVSLEQLKTIPTLSPKFLDRHSAAILQTLQAADQVPEKVSAPTSALTDNRALLKKLQKTTAEVAAKNNLAAGLLASKKTLLDLLTDSTDNPLLHGWRQQVLGSQLLDIINAQQQHQAVTTK